MAGPYFVDHAGSNTDPYETWAKAAPSIQDLDTAKTFASGEYIYIGADSNCTDKAAALTITGPTSGLPTVLISSTVGSGSDVAYSVGTGDQILATGGDYDITFDGAFALYGIRIKAQGDILFYSDTDECLLLQSVICLPGPNQAVFINTNSVSSGSKVNNLVVDLSQDSGASAGLVLRVSSAKISGISFLNATNRTGSVIQHASDVMGAFEISGADFSNFQHATACEIITAINIGAPAYITNSLTHTTWTAITGTINKTGASILFTNVGPADAPSSLIYANYYGTCESSPADAPGGSGNANIYRSSGATVESDATAWLVTTNATCSESAPFCTPWIYGVVSSTGNRTFTLYITNDTADFDNSQVWLEVEYLGTSDEAIWALGSDQRDNNTGAFISITEAVDTQTDDTTSTWNGTGPSFTYKQSLAVTATVNETGQFRARVAVGVASIASSRYFYVDPKVTVT